MPISYPGNPAGGGLTTPAPGPDVNPGSDIPQDLVDEVDAASVAPGFETSLDWVAYFARMRSLNDALGGAARKFDGPSNPTAWNDLLTSVGDPVSGLEQLPTFAAASGFDVTVGAGNGNVFTSVGIGAGESTFRRVYWASQNLTHANPDPTNPRYDAITVTPAAFGTPSTLAVVTGTPATLPIAPSVAAGTFVLFYVYVGAAVADSTHFRACRGLGRRVGYPWSGVSGILEGCELSWDYTADPSTTPADVYVGAGDQTGSNVTVNRILIDGELIEWVGRLSNTLNNVVSDSTADPFATPASASNDRPYYFYAVGGRHNPLPSNSGTGFLNPITVCESTVVPNPKTGKPTGNLTVNGVTVTPDGALYIGLGFVVLNTSRRRGCLMDGEMTHSLLPMQQFIHAFSGGGRENAGTFLGGCAPPISTKMRMSIGATTATGIDTEYAFYVANHPTPGSGFLDGWIGQAPGGGGSVPTMFEYLDFSYTPRHGADLWVQSMPVTGTAYGVIELGARAFNHRVRRLLVAP